MSKLITLESPAARASRSPAASDTVLDVRELRVSFFTEEGEVRAVDGVSFVMKRGRILALVGESGCGKSVTSYSMLLHQSLTKAEARAKAVEMPGKVGVPGPEKRIDQYPFEMSGGMRHARRGGSLSLNLNSYSHFFASRQIKQRKLTKEN